RHAPSLTPDCHFFSLLAHSIVSNLVQQYLSSHVLVSRTVVLNLPNSETL
ncbi:mCG1048989, partial [Mus musculus]